MIRAEKTFHKILREYGYNVLLQRRLSDNFLYSDTLERYTARSRIPRISELAHSQDEANEGLTTSVDLIFYFEANVNPKEGDRIYEENPTSINNSNIYIIDYALPMRGRLGKIIFWTVGASRERPS